jgi:hypothetical protein
MNKSKPLTDEDGEVRELLMKDITEFRPIAEIASSSLTQKLGLQSKEADVSSPAVRDGLVEAARAHKRKAAAAKARKTRNHSTG